MEGLTGGDRLPHHGYFLGDETGHMHHVPPPGLGLSFIEGVIAVKVDDTGCGEALRPFRPIVVDTADRIKKQRQEAHAGQAH